MAKRKLFIPVITVLLLLLSFSIVCAGETIEIILLHTNDMHGHMFPYENKKIIASPEMVGGFQNMATLIKKERRENPGRVLLLDAGDIAQGTIHSNLSFGLPMVELMNHLKYDATVLGNHEFDWGEDRLADIIESADFPVLDSNIVLKEDGTFIKGTKAYTIKEINGVKIGVIGIGCTDTSSFGATTDINRFYFNSAEETLKNYIPILKYIHKADIIIALTHLDYEKDRELAENVPGIDIIVGGHSHTVLQEPDVIKNTIILQAGSYGAYLGKLKFQYDTEAKKIISYEGELITVSDSEIEDDPEVAWMLEGYKKKYDTIAEELLGESAVDMNKSRTEETSIGNLFTDIMKLYGKADVAILNSGGIRANLPAGPITMEKLYEVFPFDNMLVTMDLKGEYLRDIMVNCLSGNGSILQVSGINITYDRTKPQKEGLIEFKVNGKPLDPEAVYKVATADFLVLGGDGHSNFNKGENVVKVMLIRDAVERYLKTNSPIYSEVEGRINIIE